MQHFTQLRYLPFYLCKPDLDTSLSAIISYCGTDIRNMMQSYGSAKVWLTYQVRYEPANPRDQKNKPFEFYLICAATRFFRREPTEGGDGAPYAEPHRELFERIKKLNATFIREQSGLVLAGILQLVLRGVRYLPFAGGFHRELLPYLKANKLSSIFRTRMIAASATLYCVLDAPRNLKHNERPALYTKLMFQRNNLTDLPYPIPPNNVHLYEDQLQININVFSFFNDEGKARHPLLISKKLYLRTANLLYWDEDYAPITDIPRLCYDISKHKQHKNICLRCLGSCYTEESLFKHQRRCTRKDFMSVLHVYPAA